MFNTDTIHDVRTGMYLLIMHTRIICRNVCLNFTLRYVLARPSIIQNNRYHGCALEVKLLLYGVNRPPRLVLRLGMNRLIPLIPFCACIACRRDIFTVSTACCFYEAADSIDEAVFVQHMAVWISGLDQSCGMSLIYILRQALAWTSPNYTLQHLLAGKCIVITTFSRH